MSWRQIFAIVRRDLRLVARARAVVMPLVIVPLLAFDRRGHRLGYVFAVSANRQGITFVFDSGQRRFRYDGEAWQELMHRYPNSPQAAEARKRMRKEVSTTRP